VRVSARMIEIQRGTKDERERQSARKGATDEDKHARVLKRFLKKPGSIHRKYTKQFRWVAAPSQSLVLDSIGTRTCGGILRITVRRRSGGGNT
jgi:hypothetical protein